MHNFELISMQCEDACLIWMIYDDSTVFLLPSVLF